MGAQERVSNEPLIPMNSMSGGTTAQRDPPPYAYSALSPPQSPPPTTKTIISPPPRESTFSPIPDTPTTSSHVPATPAPSELPQTVTESRERLLAQDARFADVVLTHVILPRARVGILRCKDKSSFTFIPQTEDDAKENRHRTRYDEELGFSAKEYKYRYHAVESLVREGLMKEGFRVKELKIKDRPWLNDYIGVHFRLKKTKGKRRAQRQNGQGGYESDSSGCDCCV